MLDRSATHPEIRRQGAPVGRRRSQPSVHVTTTSMQQVTPTLHAVGNGVGTIHAASWQTDRVQALYTAERSGGNPRSHQELSLMLVGEAHSKTSHPMADTATHAQQPESLQSCSSVQLSTASASDTSNIRGSERLRFTPAGRPPERTGLQSYVPPLNLDDTSSRGSPHASHCNTPPDTSVPGLRVAQKTLHR